MCLNFDCGAQIKLGFAAEFSNVLVIYTHIIKKPEDMSFCQAHVTDFTQVSVLSQVQKNQILYLHANTTLQEQKFELYKDYLELDDENVFASLQDLDVDPKEMNRETPEETGIYLLSSSLPQHCLYTRLSSLQKLRVTETAA